MSNDTFDLKRIKQLVNLMKTNDLTDVEFRSGDGHIILRRGSPPAVLPNVPVASPVHVASPPPVVAVSEEPANTTIIKSPMVGTFYSASSPNAPPFVNVGDTVTPEKTVCLIEAMKVYNEIQAECHGKIVDVLVKNGETVEYGRPLFCVAPV